MDTETKEKNSVMNITEQQKAYENFKAFYYMLNASTDCKSIVYNKNIRVDKEDLIDLCTKVVDKFQNNYLEDGYKINVHLTFNDHKIVDFIAWDTFVNYKFPNTKLSNIVIEWEYMLKLPNYRLPQLHKLIVKISDGISPEEMLNLLIAGRLEDIDEFEQGVFPLAARVDFVNNVISDELLQIVKDWAEGVRLNDKNRRFLFKLKRFRRQIAYFLNYFTTFFSVFCGIRYINGYLKNHSFKLVELTSNHLIYLLDFLFKFCILIFFVYKLSQLISNFIFKTLEDVGENHVFEITKGDKKEIDRIKKNEDRKKRHVIINLIITIIINIACGVLTNMIL